MDKKSYNKPVLNSRKIELGVFGSYNDPRNGQPGRVKTIPIDVVDGRRYFHMD